MNVLRVFLPGRGPLPAPRHDPGIAALSQRLFWAWAAGAGLALFTAWWMHTHGWWARLVHGDPSGISAGIVVLALVLSAWCGRRAWWLQVQAQPGSAWRRAYAAERARTPDLALHLLAERSHGPHETAWWFAAATIKLGLLGTVVGFIVMATQIGRMPNFDLEQVQTLLQQMTAGMAIALYTTLVGLAANLWLGLQLLLLDRMADRIAADVLSPPSSLALATPQGGRPPTGRRSRSRGGKLGGDPLRHQPGGALGD